MAVTTGSEPFGLWVVTVSWQGDAVYRVHFGRAGPAGSVHPLIRRYLRGQEVDLAGIRSPADEGEGTSAAICRAVRRVGYGEVATYGDIAEQVGTSPRAVGQAMARNPTPLVIPCHRIVSKNGLGGFTPPLEIKRDLLAMERSVRPGRSGGRA
jgi:methylated-DNA-[protein]-cysteine S-methyltransferase